MKVKVLYFASLKERLLKGEDTVEVPEDVKTVEDLINYLSENDAALKAAFEEMPRLRFAVNQEMAKESTVLKDGDEVASSRRLPEVNTLESRRVRCKRPFAEIFNDRRRAPSRDRNEIAVDRSIQVCDHDFGSAPVVWSFP